MRKILSFAITLLLLSGSVMASDKNWMMRMRGILVNPDESGTPSVIGGEASLSNDSVPEVDFSYFFNKNFALELILATTTHHVSVKGATNNTTSFDLGEVSLLPPILLAQYHHQINQWKPYVGLGLNYTMFYGEDPGALKSVSYDDGFGYALQVGMDYEFQNDMFINFDVKKLFLSTDLAATTYADVNVTADVEIDPWILGLGLGFRF